MKKLTVPEPSLKLVKDFCYLGVVKASQRLSFHTDDEVNSTFNIESILDIQGESKTTAATNEPPFVIRTEDSGNMLIA